MASMKVGGVDEHIDSDVGRSKVPPGSWRRWARQDI